jgi:indolepyruvate ferredoxin oxidoreductase alpha subunit
MSFETKRSLLIQSTPETSGPETHDRLLLTNEAMAWAAVEAGVSFAAAYPGTPSTEIATTLARLARDLPFHFELAVNEKVALEMAAGVALSGLRALAVMKHVGLNVALDPLVSLASIGIDGGMVIICCADPSCRSSQNEQDDRRLAQLAGIPCLEPATTSEAHDMVVRAFSISEELGLPVMVLPAARLCHSGSVLSLGAPDVAAMQRPGRYEKDDSWIIPPVHHRIQLAKLRGAQMLWPDEPFNREYEPAFAAELGIVAAGAAFGYVDDLMRKERLPIGLLKLGTTHPLPQDLCRDFLAKYRQVLVVEELAPYIETELAALAGEVGCRVLGKRSGHLPENDEYTPEVVIQAVMQCLDREVDIPSPAARVPVRLPSLCPGCPHRAMYLAVRQALQKIPGQDMRSVIFPTDIGCYALGGLPPMNMGDFILSMGSGIGSAGGLALANDQPVIAFIGDSTFYHAGIPALINAVQHGHRLTLVIMDNATTAMTGLQPTPATPGGDRGRAVPLENLVRGCGAEFLQIVDPYDEQQAAGAIGEAMAYDGPAVIISRRECLLLDYHAKRKELENIFQVDPDTCIGCLQCISDTDCPAFAVLPEEDDETRSAPTVMIEPSLCAGCGVCASYCPAAAIEPLTLSSAKEVQ